MECCHNGCERSLVASVVAKGRPIYGVLPPKVLLQAGLVEANEVFAVRRALYGLRESPALWASHRTDVLIVDYDKGKLWLKQLATDGELWMVLSSPDGVTQPNLVGILVTYVDDLLYLADAPVIELLHGRISTIGPRSSLEYAADGLRYLGMELKQGEEEDTLSQEAYISNLVRLHGLEPTTSAGLPCPREWIQDEGLGEEENYDAEELTRAQKVPGECLWLAYRTRPDILYVTNYMAATTTKMPVRVYQIGLKVISYLHHATAGLKLKVEATAESTEITQTTAQPLRSQATTTAEFAAAEHGHAKHQAGFKVGLSGYSDASFAPLGNKSFGCSLAMIGRAPVSWKAGKQPMVAMSVCEAELMEGPTCALLLESTQAMLKEILPDTGAPVLYIDNQAAENILNGAAGSWRTRHLCIRHAYVLDRASSGQLQVNHLAGEDQPADLPTKLHSKARLLHLLGTWGMVGIPALDEKKVIGLKLGVLLLLLAIQSLAVEAAKDPLPVTGTAELVLMLLLTCMSAVALWEAGKAIGERLVPLCCGTQRSKKTCKLRELARIAAEAEVEKWVEEPIGLRSR